MRERLYLKIQELDRCKSLVSDNIAKLLRVTLEEGPDWVIEEMVEVFHA